MTELDDQVGQALVRRDLERLKASLAQGADPNAMDALGMTLCYSAIMLGDRDALSALLEAGADPNLKNEYNGHTAFQTLGDFGVRPAHLVMVDLLAKHGGDINAGAEGQKPLDQAIHRMNGPIVDKLVEAGAFLSHRQREELRDMAKKYGHFKPNCLVR